MAITYEFDVAPHLSRARVFRWMRKERYAQIHAHDGSGLFWRTLVPALLLFWSLVGYGIYSLS